MNRFFLALSLSFLVLILWMKTQAPLPDPADEGQVGSGDSASVELNGSQGAGDRTSSSGLAGGPDSREMLPGRQAAEIEEFHEITIGTPGEAGGPEEAGHYWMSFSNRGAQLSEMRFLDYVEHARMSPEERLLPENWTPLVEPFIGGPAGSSGSLLFERGESAVNIAPESLIDVLWQMEKLDDGARFTYAPGTGVVFVKTIRVVPGTWHLDVSLELINNSAGDLGRASFHIIPAGVVPPALGDTFYPEPIAVAVSREKRGAFEIESESAPSADAGGGALDVGSEGLSFAGVHNKYFAFLLRDAEGQAPTLRSARWEPLVEIVSDFEDRKPEKRIRTKIQVDLELPDEGASETWNWTVYAGPKDPDVLREDFPAHGELLRKDLSGFSMFAAIGRFLLWFLGLLHKVFGNWGVSIIVMTICVRGVMFPLTRRSQTSMARYQTKMKRVQPRIEEIKKRFENEPKKLREAQAKVMQEEGAFPPLGGCLPMFVQIPIFFGLFSALRTSWQLRQADFGFWIHDLSLPDRLMVLDVKIPLLITTLDLSYLNLLPLIMVVLWILQQRGMPQPSDAQAKQMQKIMMFMPVLFGVFLYNYAAGLSLYMITQSGLGIVEQRVIKKLWPIDDTEVVTEKKKKAGCGPFAGALDNLAQKHRAEMERVEKAKRAGKTGTKKKRK
ncbi:MAG: YidC/Oxa1 family membrane protein insertase [Planctomycetota bacterium]